MRTMTLVALLALGLSGCTKEKTSPAPASGTQAGSIEKPTGAKTAHESTKGGHDETKHAAGPFNLKVTPPEPTDLNGSAVATIELTPNKPYKVNMEYPLRLTIKTPEGVTAKKATMQQADAEKMDKKLVILKPAVTLAKAGKHTVNAELKFSVCTDKQCELKTEKVTWVASTK